MQTGKMLTALKQILSKMTIISPNIVKPKYYILTLIYFDSRQIEVVTG